MGPLSTVLRPEDQLRRAGSAGRAALNVQARIAAPDGGALPAGEVGEIVLRSPHAIHGYLDAPDRTAAAFAGGWFHSGDIGVADDEGFITVVDRIEDMIKTGARTSPRARSRRRSTPTRPSPRSPCPGSPTPGGSSASSPSSSCATARRRDRRARHCREHLAGFKIPKAIVTADALPKNASGKILKRDLREAYADLTDWVPGPRG